MHIRRIALIFVVTALLCMSACGGVIGRALPVPAAASRVMLNADTVSEDSAPESDCGDITISFVGDCMLASYMGEYNWNTFNYRADIEDPSYFFAGVSELFFADDFTVANCENVFTDRELTEVGKGGEVVYWYKSASKNAGIFTAGGVDIVSLANNHTYDYGEEGKADTIAAVEAEDLLWGDDDNAVIVEKYGIRIAILCVNMFANNRVSAITSLYDSVKDDTDFQVVYFHGGYERIYTPPDYVVEACHKLADVGVDLIIGHHPHVLQPVEEYNGVKIVYSLGNFIFGAGRGENRTAIYRCTLNVDAGAITGVSDEIIPCYVFDNRWQPAVIERESSKRRVLEFMAGIADTPTDSSNQQQPAV